MSIQPLAITLIRAELRNKKLTQMLEDMGFDCSYFIVDLSREVLEHVGFTSFPENLFKIYFGLMEQAVKEIKIENFNEMIDQWSEMIYDNLVELVSATSGSRVTCLLFADRSRMF